MLFCPISTPDWRTVTPLSQRPSLTDVVAFGGAGMVWTTGGFRAAVVGGTRCGTGRVRDPMRRGTAVAGGGAIVASDTQPVIALTSRALNSVQRFGDTFDSNDPSDLTVGYIEGVRP